MKNVFCLMLLSLFCIVMTVDAQPPSRRRAQQEAEKSDNLTVRASSQYSPSVDFPADMKWKREIYRTIDLEKEANTALYYPERPVGEQMNLFSLIFKLAIEGKINIYEYNIDGNEQFGADYVISPKDMLDRFNIYYREKLVNRRDTVIVIDNSDIPSNEVKSFFVKETNYFDDRNSTYHSKIEAICPVLHRSDEFTLEITKYPMFWVRYDDLETYLTSISLMTSDYNNVSSMTVADFFESHLYEGDIYKTTNRLNRTLAQYCPTDSAMKAEQERIEGQLKAFESNLWTMDTVSEDTGDVTDDSGEETSGQESEEANATEPANSKRVGRDEDDGGQKSETKAKTEKSKSAKKSKKERSVSSSKSPVKAAPRASVRRERR